MRGRGFVVIAVIWLLAAATLPALAANPPEETSDFSAGFGAAADETTLLPLLLELPSKPVWRPGIETGNFYMDLTNRRERIDFIGPNGKPQQTVFRFADKSRLYVYVSATDSCTESTLTADMSPFFGFLATAKPAGTEGKGANKIDFWRYRNPKGSGIKDTILGTMAAPPDTPVILQWWLPAPVWLKLTDFIPGQPDASVFNLPAACVT